MRWRFQHTCHPLRDNFKHIFNHWTRELGGGSFISRSKEIGDWRLCVKLIGRVRPQIGFRDKRSGGILVAPWAEHIYHGMASSSNLKSRRQCNQNMAGACARCKEPACLVLGLCEIMLLCHLTWKIRLEDVSIRRLLPVHFGAGYGSDVLEKGAHRTVLPQRVHVFQRVPQIEWLVKQTAAAIE